MTDSEKKKWSENLDKVNKEKKKKVVGCITLVLFKKILRKKILKHLKCMLCRLSLLLKVMSDCLGYIIFHEKIMKLAFGALFLF